MNMSQSINELAAALSKAQAEIKGAVKDSLNPFFKSSYADLESVWDACRKPLTDNGLSVMQMPCHIEGMTDTGRLWIETIVLHSSGQWISNVYSMKPVKDDPQALGSCISYARRYALASAIGIYQTDDDANTATHGKHQDKGKPAPEDPKLLTVDELIDKMTTAANAFELKARWTKYFKDIAALTGEDKVKVTMAKDRRKGEIAEQEKEKNNG